jgi:hypothetical protein
MTRRLPLAIVSALFLAAAAGAQSTTPQPAPSTLDNDPAFKRLPPEQQELMRKIMANVNKAVADERTAPPAPPKLAPPAPPAPTGCTAAPVKPPKFHIPKALQDAINKQVKQVSKQTGVDVDPNAPAQAVKDAQKNIPCPPVTPAPAQPAASK